MAIELPHPAAAPDLPAPAPPAGSEAFLGLHREGRLAAAFPSLPGLLGAMSGSELLRAGRLLSRLDPQDVLRAHPGTPTVTAAVTGHSTLADAASALTAEFARHGLLGRTTLSDYGSYVQDLSDPRSDLYAADPDLALCVLDPTVVLDEVPVPWRPADVARVWEEKLSLLDRLAVTFGATARGTLVLNTVPLPRTFLAQLVDHRSRGELSALWREANARLLRLSERHPSLVVLDLDCLLLDAAAPADPRMAVYAKVAYPPGLFAAYAREIGHLARHLLGRTRKALVLDLDETLWGGILGDDGIEGIEVADSYRGEAFRAMQKAVRQIASQGVLLAAVSKNDLEPVQSAFRDLPRMTLREDDFVRITANWLPKPDNLTALAEDLNLATDSFVFVDDSAYECGLVRHRLPEVAVVQLDTEPALHVAKLLADGWFDVRETTSEDRQRPERYREELGRKDFLHSSGSLDDYLAGLGVAVRLAEAADREVPRISQITLRTNQFNLTTQRLQPADVAAYRASPGHLVLAIHSSDRFGDNGLVGTVLLRRDGDTLHIDNFLLSCRVFARGIEQTCLAAVLRYAGRTGARAVAGRYRATAKNAKVRDFYPLGGFRTVGATEQAAEFRHDLALIAAPPTHVTLTEDFGG